MSNSTGRIELNGADEMILDALHEGRNSAANIADQTEYSRQYLTQRLIRLHEHRIVENIGNGIYELRRDPRTNERTDNNGN